MLTPASFDRVSRRLVPFARAAARAALIICLLVAGQNTRAVAQQSVAPQPQDSQAAQLREQIDALESVERDASTPPEVRLANRRFIGERRALLRALLQKQAEGWRKYLALAGPHLNPQEKAGVEKTLRDLEAELGLVEQASRDSATTVADSATVADSVAPARLSTGQAGPSNDGDAAAGPSTLRAAFNNSSADTAAAPSPALPPAAAPRQAAPLTSECYPDVLPGLADAVRNAANRIVTRTDPAQIRPAFFGILLMTMADAVFTDSVDDQAARAKFLAGIRFVRAQAETKRTDKQIGASARSEGSTSAIEKPGFAELLGFAVEHGSVEKEINGTSLTLSTSPYAFFYHGQEDTSTAYKNHGYLSRVGVSATFNIADQNNVLASATRKQLDEWSIRARLSADRSNRSYSAEQTWENFRHDFAKPDIVITGEMAATFQSDPSVEAIRKEVTGQFTAPDFQKSIKDVLDDTSITDPEVKVNKISEIILCRVRTAIFDQIRSGAFKLSDATRARLRGTFPQQLASALQARENAVTAFEAELDKLSFKPEFTFAYTNKRQETGSDYSTFKLLYQKKSREGLNIVANAGFSIYHRPDPTLHQQRLRDFAGALSLEGVLGRSPFLLQGGDESRVTFAFTGRFQRMLENRFFKDRKADIAVAQFKLELPLLAGISLPFSVTYANATELIKESHVRTNFGFTIDTDKILQIINLAKASQVK
ncbi:MAG: hypothetical protein M3444_15485 [Acidobacteriota bacterium]|nr:hypothetical protein [Acidobacteriota bacterium]